MNHMKRIIICEDISSTLIRLYLLLKRKYPDIEYILIKCDYNHNKSAVQEEMEEELKKELENALMREKEEISDEELPKIRVVPSPEDLIKYTYKKNDVFLLDVSLFDGIDRKCSKEYDEYSSVKFAEELVSQFDIPKDRIRFYTRDTSSTESKDFTRQTNGKWRRPEIRPTNLETIGGKKGVEMFLKKLLKKLEE